MLPDRMGFAGCHLIFSLLSLCVFWINSTGGQTTTEPSCVLSIPNNFTLFKRLSGHFHKESDVKIVEYNITFNKVSSKFNLLNQSSPNAFQPWIWYRTQGYHSPCLLRSYDNYFETLHRLLHEAVETESIQLDVSPPDCLDHLRNESLEDFIRRFLVNDFDINGISLRRVFHKSEDMKICSARIDGNDGIGRLVFNCCDINYEQIMICKEVSAEWEITVLNIVLLVWTGFVLTLFPFVIDWINSLYGDEIYNHRLPNESDVKFDVVKTTNPGQYVEYRDKVQLEKEKWKQMECLTSALNQMQRDQKITARVRAVTNIVASHKLFNEYEKTHSIKRLLNWFLKCKPNNEKARVAVVIAKRFLFLTILVLLNKPLMFPQQKTDTMVTKLVKAYEELGLKSSFYFQRVEDVFRQIVFCVIFFIWLLFYFFYFVFFTPLLRNKHCDKKSKDDFFNDTRKDLGIVKKWILVGLNVIYFPACFVKYLMIDPSDTSKAKYGCMLCLKIILGIFTVLISSAPLILTVFIGTHFVLHALVMFIFTLIVEVDVYYSFLNLSVIGLAFILEFFHDLGENFNPLKNTLIGMFKETCINSDDKNTMHGISSRMINDYLSRDIHGDDLVSRTRENAQEIVMSLERQQGDLPIDHDVVSRTSENSQTNELYPVGQPGDLSNGDGLVSRTSENAQEIFMPLERQQSDSPIDHDVVSRTSENSQTNVLTPVGQPGDLSNVSRTRLAAQTTLSPPEGQPGHLSFDNVQEKKILIKKGSELCLRVNYACIFISEQDIPCVSRHFLFHCRDINCVGAPRPWNVGKTIGTYLACFGIVVTVVLGVRAYGHHHYITRGHFTTLATGFVVFAIKRLSGRAKTVTAIKKRNRRFLGEIKKKIQSYVGYLRVDDFTELEILEYTKQDILLVLLDGTTDNQRQRNDDADGDNETSTFLDSTHVEQHGAIA